MKDKLDFHKKILDTVSEHIVVVNKEGQIIYANKSWKDFAEENSYKKIQWEGINYLNVCKSSASLGDEYAKKAYDGISNVIANKEDNFFLEYPCHGNNKQRWFMMHVTSFIEENENFIVISHQNITTRVLNEQKVRQLSRIDTLTSLENRRAFNEFLLKEWNRNKRNKKPITLAMIDVDNFKILNDTHGHQIGDIALMKIARVLKKHIHRPSDLCCRYDGEEFAIIFGEATCEQILHILEDIQQDVKNIVITNIEENKETPSITLTIGISTLYPDNLNTTKELIKKADNCLYKGKKEGKNKIVFEENHKRKILLL